MNSPLQQITARLLPALAVSLSLVAVTRADVPKDVTLDADTELEDYLAVAALRNPALEAAFNRWQAAVEHVAQARSLPNPTVSYAYYIEEVETRVGPQRQKISLAQKLPWFGTRALRAEAATQSAAVERQKYEVIRRRLFRDVRRAFYNYYHLGKALEIATAHHHIYLSHERALTSRLRTGMPLTKLLALQLEHDQLMDRMDALAGTESALRARLNALLHRDVDATLAFPGTAPQEAFEHDEAELFRTLARENPFLRQLDAATAMQDAAARLARKRKYPGIQLRADYIDTGEALAEGLPDSGKDPLIAGITLELPLWRGANRAREREAELRKTAIAGERAATANQLQARLQSALVDYHDAARRVALYRDRLMPQAEQVVKSARADYQSGRLDLPMLLHTDHRLLEFNSGYERAFADRGLALAEIQMLALPATEEMQP